MNLIFKYSDHSKSQAKQQMTTTQITAYFPTTYLLNISMKIRQSQGELLVFHRVPPPVADRVMLTRYGGYRRNKIPGADQN